MNVPDQEPDNLASSNQLTDEQALEAISKLDDASSRNSARRQIKEGKSPQAALATCTAFDEILKLSPEQRFLADTSLEYGVDPQEVLQIVREIDSLSPELRAIADKSMSDGNHPQVALKTAVEHGHAEDQKRIDEIRSKL